MPLPSFLFTTCSQTGRYGPDSAAASSYYAASHVRVEIVGSGIQKWIVPYSGRYLIQAAGAQGKSCDSNHFGGFGAVLGSFFRLQRNSVLFVLVGQVGTSDSLGWGGGGGGASFVAIENATSSFVLTVAQVGVSPLLIAAGGGGSTKASYAGEAAKGKAGSAALSSEGGGIRGESFSCGGAGFSSNLTKSFLNGGVGSSAFDFPSYLSYGGFGGGGAPFNCGGGGGGYRGGDSGATAGNGGDGGSSFNSGELLMSLDGAQTGEGYVQISLDVSPACTSNPQFLFRFLLIFLFLDIPKIEIFQFIDDPGKAS
jgi:hypothetical protein